MKYKVGDRVKVAFPDTHSLRLGWTGVYTVISISSHDIVRLAVSNSYIDKSGAEFYTKELIPEEIYNSPLYQALKEEN